MYLELDKAKNKNEEYIESLIKKVKDAGAIGINFNKDNASFELVHLFRENDLLVSIWTVDKKTEMHEIISYRPDNITTRRPDILKRELEIVENVD